MARVKAHLLEQDECLASRSFMTSTRNLWEARRCLACQRLAPSAGWALHAAARRGLVGSSQTGGCEQRSQPAAGRVQAPDPGPARAQVAELQVAAIIKERKELQDRLASLKYEAPAPPDLAPEQASPEEMRTMLEEQRQIIGDLRRTLTHGARPLAPVQDPAVVCAGCGASQRPAHEAGPATAQPGAGLQQGAQA